ncbi:MAG: helix-turn-helix domain-containing protein [Gemmatimonas sp.]
MPCVVTLLKRDRARAMVRAAFPRRRAHVVAAKSAADVESQLVKELVDAVIIDAGAGDDAHKLIARADEFSSVPFVVVTTLLPADTPLQVAVWQSVVKRAGRPVRTDQLARELSVSREHLSRSFATGQAPTLKKVIDLVRVLAAAELSKNSGYDVRDVAEVLGFASSSHLSSTTQRLVGAKASSLSRLRAMDLLERFSRYASGGDDDEAAG